VNSFFFMFLFVYDFLVRNAVKLSVIKN